MYPDIDRSPESMFSKIIENPSSRIKNAFVASLQQFHFGSIITQIGKIASKGFQPAYKNSINIHNPGTLPVTITPRLKDNGNNKAVAWFIDQKPVTVESGETTQIQFALHPFQQDTFLNTLMLFIQDNPDPYFLNIVADVCVPTIECSTMNIEFDKILAKQEKEVTFDLKNVGRVPAVF